MSETVAYVGIAVSILGFVPLYIDLISRWISRNKIEFELEKFYEVSANPVKSLYGVRVLHPSKAIDLCGVYLNSEPLPWWDSTRDRPNYVKKIAAGSGGNVRVPESIRNDNAVVTVKNGSKTLRKVELGKIAKADA